MIKKRILSLWISLCVICIAGAQEKELAYCNRQIYKTLKAVGTSSKLPRAIEAGKSSWDMVTPHDWTSGFFPGVLWYDYEYSHEPEIKEKAVHFTKLLESLSSKVTSHDMGFQMFCSYGHAYRLTKDNYYKDILLKSADELAKLYNPRVGTLLSWPWKVKESNWPHNTIIDNMMNLELLMEAYKLSGDTTLRHIALSHADKTMKCQYRKNYSCPHVVDYDAETGEVRKFDWNNGSDDVSVSTWARGQAWGLYGLTMMYRETNDPKYLRHAEYIADFLIHHPNLPADGIPYWDYSGSGVSTLRDTSAASIMASALIELSTYSANKDYFKTGEKILKNLSSDKYLAKPGKHSFFILKQAIGNYLRNSELEGGLSYADYYYVEGLLRYFKQTN